ncbi:MAG: sigma-70 family RNA polymerase sigma factor [Planctomycetes bacterium]|nr:sigma-70 family RNA polymerase sigma factor [Planctomycetota bacterium]
MSDYRQAEIASLATQLKRGPVRLRLRQLSSIEFLLSLIEPGKRFPFDFLQHTLTGFRPRSTVEAGAGTSTLDSEDLRVDLITLAEDLSATADINPTWYPEPLHTLQDVARRFDVSTKTVFRWHYRGLIGWRARGEDRRFKLVFPDRCIRRFVAENLELVKRGRSFSQLSAAERETVIARARELFEAGEKTVNAVAKVICAETGRAVETIRLILKNYDDTHPQRGIFNRSALRVDVDDVRLKIWEAYRDGTSPIVLAERLDKPREWIEQAIVEMRLREMKAQTIEFVHSPDFEAPTADADILEHSAARSPYDGSATTRRVPTDLPAYLQELFRYPLLSPYGERALFRKLNYLRYKAKTLRDSLEPGVATAEQVDEVERLLTDAAEVKNQITQSNLRLVVSIAKRHFSTSQDFFELVSDGNVSLMRAIDKFDFTRGFKFSTYGSWAIIRNFARSMPEERSRQERYQTGRDELLDTASALDFEEAENETLPAVRSTVERMLASLDERDRGILRQRFGLDAGGEPATLEQIGQRFGVSKERIRQLEARAIAKLREEFDDDSGSLIG